MQRTGVGASRKPCQCHQQLWLVGSSPSAWQQANVTGVSCLCVVLSCHGGITACLGFWYMDFTIE